MSASVRPEVVALWLDCGLIAGGKAARLLHHDGVPFTDEELSVAWSITDDEQAAVHEVLELRVAEAEALLSHAEAQAEVRAASMDARVAAADKEVADLRAELDMLHRRDYQDHCRRRADHRGWDRNRPWAPPRWPRP